jgi:hypothetical protein
MTVEEYLELVKGTDTIPVRRTRTTAKPKRKSGKKDPKMARALRKANQLGRTKAGKLRKGYTQAKIMKKAHQLRRRMR